MSKHKKQQRRNDQGAEVITVAKLASQVIDLQQAVQIVAERQEQLAGLMRDMALAKASVMVDVFGVPNDDDQDDQDCPDCARLARGTRWTGSPPKCRRHRQLPPVKR